MDFPGRLIAGFAAIVLLVLFPLQYFAQAANENIDNLVEDRVKTLSNDIRDKGYLDTAMYEDFIRYLDKTGELYDFDIENIHPVTGEEVGLTKSTKELLEASLVQKEDNLIYELPVTASTDTSDMAKLPDIHKIRSFINKDKSYLLTTASAPAGKLESISRTEETSSYATQVKGTLLYTLKDFNASNNYNITDGDSPASTVFIDGCVVNSGNLTGQEFTLPINIDNAKALASVRIVMTPVGTSYGYLYGSGNQQATPDSVASNSDGTWTVIYDTSTWTGSITSLGFDTASGTVEAGTTKISSIELWGYGELVSGFTSTYIPTDFTYTGSAQTYTAPVAGTYRVEAWGAQGGTWNGTCKGGKGGYTSGEISLTAGEVLTIDCGESYNGGTYHVPHGALSGAYEERDYYNPSINYSQIAAGGGRTTIGKASTAILAQSAPGSVTYLTPISLARGTKAYVILDVYTKGNTRLGFSYSLKNDQNQGYGTSTYYGYINYPTYTEIRIPISAIPEIAEKLNNSGWVLTHLQPYVEEGYIRDAILCVDNYSYALISGGGGGAGYHKYHAIELRDGSRYPEGSSSINGGAGGGLIGGSGLTNGPSYIVPATGGTQTENGYNSSTVGSSRDRDVHQYFSGGGGGYFAGGGRPIITSYTNGYPVERREYVTSGAGGSSFAASYLSNVSLQQGINEGHGRARISRKITTKIEIKYVNLDTLVSISVNPNKISVDRYTDVLNLPITLTAHYKSSGAKIVTGYILSGYEQEKLGLQNAVISYNEFGVTQTTPLTITVTKLHNICPKCELSYELNEDDSDPGCPFCKGKVVGLEVTPSYVETVQGEELPITVQATYADGSTASVTGWTSNYDIMRTGMQTVAIKYLGLSQEISVWVHEGQITCPICTTRYDASEGSCPICAETVTSITVSPFAITVKQYDNINLHVYANYADGHSQEVIDWSIDILSSKAGTFNATVSYQKATALVLVTVLPLSSVTCPICGLTYDTGVYPNGCPQCSIIVTSIEAYFVSGSSLVQYGSSPGIAVILIYRDTHREIILDGYTLEGYDPFKMGKQTITVHYGDHSTTIDIEVVNTLKTILCPSGHVYYLREDGSDPGCPYCQMAEGLLSTVYYYDITYTAEIIELIYQDGIYYFDKENYITVQVVKRDKSILIKMQRTFFKTSILGRKRRYIYGGRVF